MTEISCSRVGYGTKCCRKCPTVEEDGLRYFVWEMKILRDFRKVICITSVLIRSHVAREWSLPVQSKVAAMILWRRYYQKVVEW